MGTVVAQKITYAEIQAMPDDKFAILMRRTFDSDLAHLSAGERLDIELRIAHLQKGYMRDRFTKK